MLSIHQVYLRCAHVSRSSARYEKWTPPLNAYRCQDGVLFCADLAGVSLADVHVSAEPHRLVISGKRKPLMVDSHTTVVSGIIALEIDEGEFEREVVLPWNVDCSAVRAHFRSGILRIFLPFNNTEEP